MPRHDGKGPDGDGTVTGRGNGDCDKSEKTEVISSRPRNRRVNNRPGRQDGTGPRSPRGRNKDK